MAQHAESKTSHWALGNTYSGTNSPVDQRSSPSLTSMNGFPFRFLLEVFDTHRPVKLRRLLVSYSAVYSGNQTLHPPLGFGLHTKHCIHFSICVQSNSAVFKQIHHLSPLITSRLALVWFSVANKLGTFSQKFWTIGMEIYSVQNISPHPALMHIKQILKGLCNDCFDLLLHSYCTRLLTKKSQSNLEITENCSVDVSISIRNNHHK